MSKRYLFTPGPVPIASEVLLSMARPILHHRASTFIEIFKGVKQGLKDLFKTGQDVLVLSCSGTGAMEASVVNLLSPGDTAIVINGGKFGARWGEICKKNGIKVVEVVVPWGQAVDPADVKRALDASPEAKAVFCQASETSTGVKHPVGELAKLTANRPDTVIVVDAISALAVFDLPMDAWGLDVVVGGSQKALMLPPGMAFVALSDKAWKLVGQSKTPKYYFDLLKEKKKQAAGQTAYTTAVTHVVALAEALKKFNEIGLDNLFARNRLLHKAVTAGAAALGIKPFAEKSPSEAVAAFWSPEGVDGTELKDRMDKHYMVTIAGGQDDYKGKIFRIGLLGDVGHFDAVVAISALEMALADLGYQFALGAGVAAVQRVLREGWV